MDLLNTFKPLGDKARNIQEFKSAEAAVTHIQKIYKENTDIIHHAFTKLLECGATTKETTELLQNATYPFIGINVETKNLFVDARLSFGMASEPGIYGTTVTRPDLFANYYREQIQYLIDRHRTSVVVGMSSCQIPLPFVVEHTTAQLDEDQLLQMQTGFMLPNLSRIDDSIANGTYQVKDGFPRPLALFTGERVDFSLHRLHHYTGTSSEHFQSFVLLTNYQRYIDEFIVFGKKQLEENDEYTALVSPGNQIIENPRNAIKTPFTKQNGKQHLPQMPAYHLKRKDGQGITFINIGVGPSNAKTITDHLAVLRPHCWIMLGHCAGLRSTQTLGDYVLAHGYVREDHVLDEDLPSWVPVPPIAEVQVALQQAVTNISELKGVELKTRMRTGTLITTANRNWELRTHELFERFKQSRAIAVDMESATVAANGFRFRVPYGTLLCVSDKPIHGEIKLQGMANAFYRQSINQHLQIGLEAIRILREQGADSLHSRKLRGFDEPPFR